MREHSVSHDEVTGRMQLEEKEFAGMKGPKLRLPTRLPKVYLGKIGNCRQETEPVEIRDSHIEIDHLDSRPRDKRVPQGVL
jgi:hypothetical protein